MQVKAVGVRTGHVLDEEGAVFRHTKTGFNFSHVVIEAIKSQDGKGSLAFVREGHVSREGRAFAAVAAERPILVDNDLANVAVLREVLGFAEQVFVGESFCQPDNVDQIALNDARVFEGELGFVLVGKLAGYLTGGEFSIAWILLLRVQTDDLFAIFFSR